MLLCRDTLDWTLSVTLWFSSWNSTLHIHDASAWMNYLLFLGVGTLLDSLQASGMLCRTRWFPGLLKLWTFLFYLFYSLHCCLLLCHICAFHNGPNLHSTQFLDFLFFWLCEHTCFSLVPRTHLLLTSTEIFFVGALYVPPVQPSHGLLLLLWVLLQQTVQRLIGGTADWCLWNPLSCPKEKCGYLTCSFMFEFRFALIPDLTFLTIFSEHESEELS